MEPQERGSVVLPIITTKQAGQMQPHPDLSPVPDLDEDLIAGLDSFIADHVHPEAGTLSRNDAINRILRDWLTGQGYVAPDAETLDFDDPEH